MPIGLDSPRNNSAIVRLSTMMVQDIQNPEYFSPSGDSWSERCPVHLIPYPSAMEARSEHHRDKRAKTTDTTAEILGYFYHDVYPCEVRKERLKINELVDVVAVPASSASHSFDSMLDEKEQQQGWHILWFQRRSLYDGIGSASPMVPSSPVSFSLAQQALMLLLYSRTERTLSGKAVVTPNNDGLLGCANLQWIVQNEVQRDALLRALPAPYTVVTPDSFGTLTPQRNDGRLRQSLLQLPTGALLVLDLVSYTGGSVDPVLQTLLETHRLEYSFEGGMRIPFEADYRLLVITKSMLLNSSPENTFTVQIDPEFGSDIWTILPKLSDRVELPAALLESAVETYASLSQKSQDMLHRWLLATRSVARYHGRTTATSEDWDTAYQLERKLRETLAT